jgi:hypothetical protein
MRSDRLTRGVAFATVTAIAAASAAANSLEVDGIRYFWLDDDQMISMRFARNVAQGFGFVWNPNEAVEGYTNFLWVAVMAALHALPIGDAHASLAVKIVNWALSCEVLLLAERLLLRFHPRPGVLLPALVRRSPSASTCCSGRSMGSRPRC